MKGLYAWARTKLGTGYVYGSQGEVMTQARLNELIGTFGIKHYVFSDGHGMVDAKKWLGKESHDCSGLVLDGLAELGAISNKADYTADGIYDQLCTPITRAELKPEDLVFADYGEDGNMDHIGIYTDKGTVIHARGTRYGVVETELLSSFTKFGRLKVKSKSEIAVPTPEVKDADKELAQKLRKKEYITDEEYWEKVLKGQVPVNLKYLKILLNNTLK
jgi:cell wall-associated NlpC family hydrolase